MPCRRWASAADAAYSGAGWPPASSESPGCCSAPVSPCRRFCTRTITVSPPGGPLVFVCVFYAISLYALPDFAVGHVAPVLVGAVRAATWVMWGVVAFYAASYAATGEFGALVFMAVPAVAAVALMLLVRWIRNGQRRPGGVPPG